MLSYKTLFFNTLTTSSYAFLPQMSKSLHAVLINIWTSGGDPLSPLLKRTAHPSLFSHPWVGLQKSVSEQQWVPFLFHMEEFTPTLVLHPSYGNTVWWNRDGKVQPLLPPHQHPSLTSWANVTGGIIFGEALVIFDCLLIAGNHAAAFD